MNTSSCTDSFSFVTYSAGFCVIVSTTLSAPCKKNFKRLAQ